MDEQQYLKALRDELEMIHDKMSSKMDMETYHMFESLRMLVRGKVKL